MLNNSLDFSKKFLSPTSLSEIGLKDKKPPITIGVFGGMGPLTGYDYFKWLVNMIPAKADTDHPGILFWSDPTIPRKDKCNFNSDFFKLPAKIEESNRYSEFDLCAKL